MSSQPQPAFWVCSALNGIAATVWVLLLLETSAWSSSISDYGAAAGLVGLFFLIPFGTAVWWTRRRRSQRLSGWKRAYVCVSGLLLAGTWAVSLFPMIFWIGILSVGASRLWPLNLREGPDTAFAKEQFEQHFRMSPDMVDGLYCRRDWEFGDGNTYRMKFHFRDPAILENIVRFAGLEELSTEKLESSWLVESGGPEWWPGTGFSEFDQAFGWNSRARLWVDREKSIAYYRSWP